VQILEAAIVPVLTGALGGPMSSGQGKVPNLRRTGIKKRGRAAFLRFAQGSVRACAMLVIARGS